MTYTTPIIYLRCEILSIHSVFRPNTAVAAEVKVKLMQYVQDFPQRTPVKGDRTLLIINMKSRHVTIVDEGTSNCSTYVLLDV